MCQALEGPLKIADKSPGDDAQSGSISILRLGLTFLAIGGGTFGGMWGAMQRLEDELVRRRGWLTSEEQKAMMVAATLIPAPKFLAFGGMVGFHLGGWTGSIVSLVALLTPPALLVVLGVILLSPNVVGEAILPLQRTVGVAVIGLLFGNAYLQLTASRVRGRQWLTGILLAAGVAAATLAGVPLIISAIAGFVIGALLIREGQG
jgi:chromate transporter